MKHEDYLTEKDFAHIDISIMLEYEEGFSSIEKCTDCVKAVYTDSRSGQPYPVRMECCRVSKASKTFRVETDFRCPVIRPEFTENVSLYIRLTNEKMNSVNVQNSFERSNFILKETENGSIILVQALCHDHEDIPSAVKATLKVISAFGDDLICLASGRIPTDLPKDRSLKEYQKMSSFDREYLSSAEDPQNLKNEFSANAPCTAERNQSINIADSKNGRVQDAPDELDDSDKAILERIKRDLEKMRSGYKSRYFKNSYLIEDENEEVVVPFSGVSASSSILKAYKRLKERKVSKFGDDDLL